MLHPCLKGKREGKEDDRTANKELRMSAAGMASLRRREDAVLRYYNDLANNCTFGVGTLVHSGRCTDEELQRPVTVEHVD